MAIWPTTLPNPLIDGYGIEPTQQFIRTDMESGSPRQRRRSSARCDIVPVAWNLTDTQMAAFQAWYDDPTEADGGAGWFTISLWRGDGGASSAEARFAGAWKAKMSGNHRWIVTAQLELRN